MKLTHRDFKKNNREFLDSPVVSTPCFHCHGPGFDPDWGTKTPQGVWPKKIFLIKKQTCGGHRRQEKQASFGHEEAADRPVFGSLNMEGMS